MPLVTKTITYLSNQFQCLRNSLWGNTPLCILSHSNRYFGPFLSMSRIRDDPGRKQVFLCQIFSLTNITAPASFCMIRSPKIIQRTIFQVWLYHCDETLYIDLKYVIARLRFIVNNVQIFILQWRIPTHLWCILHMSMLLVTAPHHQYVSAVTISRNKSVTNHHIVLNLLLRFYR